MYAPPIYHPAVSQSPHNHVENNTRGEGDKGMRE